MRFFFKFHTLASALAWLFVRTAVHAIRRCGPHLCRQDHVCCAQRNSTVTCCRQFSHGTYYTMATITRKLAGVFILILLFTVGYLIRRLFCARSGGLAGTQHGGHVSVPTTASREQLVDACSPVGPSASPSLPSYEECTCKQLPTYEEALRDTRISGLETPDRVRGAEATPGSS